MSYRPSKIPLLTKVIRILSREEVDTLCRVHEGDPLHSRWATEQKLLRSSARRDIARDAGLAISRRLNAEESRGPQ